MRLETRMSGTTALLIVEGEVDLSSSTQMRTALLGAVDDDGVTGIVVNMNGVSYIDSSGVASLVEGLHKANQKGRKFGLCSLSSPARKVIELARLDRVFAIHETEQAALSN